MSKQIIVNGQPVSYLEINNVQSEYVLLFLHGWRSQKEVWSQVVSSMYQVASIYAVDLPGFGASPAPKKAWSMGDYAQTVKEFIEKLELKNVIVVGHSFGGRIGIKLASHYPELVKKLILVDSAGFAASSSKKSFMGVVAKIVKPFFKPGFMQGLRRQIYKIIGAEDYVATPELQKTFVNITNEDLTEDIKRIKTPTLLVWGEDDKETPVGFLNKMRSLMPNAKYQILSDAGHFSFLDRPEEFVNELQKFIIDKTL